MSLPIVLLDDDLDFDDLEFLEEEEIEPEPSKTYSLELDRYMDGIDAVRQAVQKILQTPLFEHEIYSFSYGIDFDSLIGREPEEVYILLKKMIREALSYDDRIVSVEEFDIGFQGDECYCEFVVKTVYGDFTQELEVNI